MLLCGVANLFSFVAWRTYSPLWCGVPGKGNPAATMYAGRAIVGEVYGAVRGLSRYGDRYGQLSSYAQENFKVVRSKKMGIKKQAEARTLTLLEYRLQPASVSFYDFEILLSYADRYAASPAASHEELRRCGGGEWLNVLGKERIRHFGGYLISQETLNGSRRIPK
jgi:hypothetical protein